MRLSPGQTIGRYVIESLLGEGGMGEVYRARDSRLERNVALKVLRNDGEDASEAWEHAVMRMQREAQAVAALSHPGIVAIYDIGEQDGAPFIAMELVAGKPLRELIGTDLPMSNRWRILLDVAKALAAAHEAGFIHRDIKPENILVRPDGSPKVLDFGIARRTSHNVELNAAKIDVQGTTIDASVVRMTADGALLGTPAYMAPEQLRGESIDARADQFAWGVVAYELLSGKHPFQADKGAMSLMASILSDTPAPLNDVPEGITRIVLRALEKEPSERWESMHEIASSAESFAIEDDARKLPTGPSQARIVAEGQTQSNPSVPERRPLPRFLIVAAVVAMTAIVSIAWFTRRSTPPVTTSSASASASSVPSAVATAITDLPIPRSNSAEARAAFREGLQSIRDARWAAAASAFQRARTADPEMAAAHFRYALIQFSFEASSAREAFRTAYGLRGVLSERDAAFLNAFEPIIQRSPSDYVTAIQRFEALVARYPLDAELLFWYGRSLNRGGTGNEAQSRAVEIMDRCSQLDPRYADCWQTKADALIILNRADEALVAIDACIAQSGNATDCLQEKIALEGTRGRCDVVVKSSRQLTNMDSLAPWPRRIYTEALYFNGAGQDAVRAAAEEGVRLFRDQKLEYEAGEMHTFVDIGFGDLRVASRKLEALGQAATASSLKRETDQLIYRAQLYAEMGQWKEGADMARNALQNSSYEDMRLLGSGFDPSMVMQSLLLRSGKISRQEYDAKRADWLAKHQATTTLEHMLQWFIAYALPAFSKDLAEDAVEQANRISNPVDLDQSPLRVPWSIYLGRLLVVAGKHQQALPHLEIATRMCTQMTTIVAYMQSLAALGIAREATGDTTGACQAYSKVLSRWGSSKESLTAKDVSRRAKKLGCDSSVK